MNLPIINVLPTTFIDHLAVANHMAVKMHDNNLDNQIDEYLASSSDFKEWRNAMPSKTPRCLSDFQNKYPKYNLKNVNTEINNIGCKLSDGQYLFHGGLWKSSLNGVALGKPFSTSFSPQVALRNAEFNAKAYDNGEIDLFVLKVTSPATNVFVFRQGTTNNYREKEVLFASGATLTALSKNKIHCNYPVGKHGHPDKYIPINVVEIAIS